MKSEIRSSLTKADLYPDWRSFIFLLFTVVSLNSFGQYTTAIGIRAGETTGLTFKKFTGASTALEGIAGVWYRGVSATALYEKYIPAFDAANLSWYFGGGAHLAFKTGESTLNIFGQRRYYFRDGGMGLGIDGIFGLEYKMPSAPIAISFDFKPFIEFNTKGGGWISLDPGLQFKASF